MALARKTGDATAQPKQSAESAAPEMRDSLQKERGRAEALATELARAQRDMETLAALASKMAEQAAQFKRGSDSKIAELQQSLQKERDRAEALASELATAGREVGSRKASKSGDETAQLKQTAENAIESLQKERDKAEALASELAMAQREVETQKGLASQLNDETTQLKQIAASAIELRQSLQNERDRAEVLASELTIARRDVETQKVLASKSGDETAAQADCRERDRVAAVAAERARQG
jgi:hypothetical protein